MKPSLGSQKGLVSRIWARAWPGVMPYLCMRNAQVTVAERDFPMALEVLLDSEVCNSVCYLLGRKDCGKRRARRSWQTTNETDMGKDRGLPVNKNATSSIESALNESIGFRKVFEQVFILYIVHLHSHVLEAIEQTLLHWQLQYSEHMCDTGFSQ